MSDAIACLQAGNEMWVNSTVASAPALFEQLAKGQAPECVWIGCADSRVSPELITQQMPGSLFVHRNIANMVIASDDSLKSVVYYALEVLKVKHIIICGHHGCGGVKAAMSDTLPAPLAPWLTHTQSVYLAHKAELDAIESSQAREDRCVALNTLAQAANMASLASVQDARAKGHQFTIHAWVYDLKSGRLKDLNYVD